MKIVITGSRGFIGSHVRESLEDKHEIVEWDIKIDKDIKDFTLDGDEDFVIHLAALTDVRDSIERPDEYWKTNIEYSKRIFNSCYAITPVIYASSSCASQWWLSPYGTTKKVMEELAHEGQVGLRFANVYGDGAPDFMLTSRLKNGNVTHKSNHIRDFIHVSDVVNVIHLFLEQGTKDKNTYYEVGTGIGITVTDLIEEHGYDVPFKEGDACEMLDNTTDITEIKKLGWSAKRNIYEY